LSIASSIGALKMRWPLSSVAETLEWLLLTTFPREDFATAGRKD
jgi:hypothetical protein